MHRPSNWQTVLLALSMLLLSFSLSAGEQPQTMSTNITFASAGVGEDDPLEIEAMRQTYNLQLLFALKGSGAFLADVTVRIYNQAAANVLTAQATGPYFFARLPPGQYRIEAEFNGKSLSSSVSISSSGRKDLYFYWESE